MMKILVPIDASSNSLNAVRHVIAEYNTNPSLEIHLLNVQPPFSQNVSRFICSTIRHDFHREQAECALQPGQQLLDRSNVPYRVHFKTGHKAACIAQAAQELQCDHIVMSTTRKNSLTRLIESSTTNKVIALTTVPVKIVAGAPASALERFGIPACVGMGLSSLFLAAIE